MTRWAASGAMALTGNVDQPSGPPARLVEAVERLGHAVGGSSLDALALLGERAALMGLWRRGATSCGGSCRLLPTARGHVAVSLPRREDLETVPAWLELDEVPATTPAIWSSVATHLAGRDPEPLVERAQLFGLPVARVGEVASDGSSLDEDAGGIVRHALGPAAPRAVAGLRVVDLSALWAGPLCGDLLAGAGATIVKVESTACPDGARRGPAAFFDLLNARKRSVALDFTRAEGRRTLRGLVERADVVIEASRPRALEQLGIVAADVVRVGGPRVWVSITGYGRHDTATGRVAFGDDAAAAGGLVVWADDSPLFCADAVADPLTGLAAAHACLEALAEGGRWLLDVSMAGVASGMAGPTVPTTPGEVVAEPRARVPAGRAPAMGADTAAVLAEVGLGG